MPMRTPPRKQAQKEPVALLWIIIGLFLSVGVMIGIERLVPRW